MKDSKVRVNMGSVGNTRTRNPDQTPKTEKVEPYQKPSKDDAAPILKWEFPGAPQQKAESAEKHRQLSMSDRNRYSMEDGPRGHRGAGEGPDAYGESGHGTRAASAPPPERPAGARAHSAAPGPSGPAAMPQGPQPAPEPQRYTP
ncbi:hypothetical protein ABEQ74_10545, partial [Paenibacillus solani]